MSWTHVFTLATMSVVVLALTAALCVRIAAAPLADAIVRIHESFRRA